MSAGEITGEYRAADSAPASAAGTKKTVVVVGYADAQDIAIICKYSGLTGKRDCGIAAVGGDVDERHTAPDPRGHRSKIEIHGPVAIAAHIDAAGIQTGHAKPEIAFEGLEKECASAGDGGVKTQQ